MLINRSLAASALSEHWQPGNLAARGLILTRR
jgi:hypothetical protein